MKFKLALLALIAGASMVAQAADTKAAAKEGVQGAAQPTEMAKPAKASASSMEKKAKVKKEAAAATTTYATTDTANDVISFITSRPVGTPWFAWAAFNAPHAPLAFPPGCSTTTPTSTWRAAA